MHLHWSETEIEENCRRKQRDLVCVCVCTETFTVRVKSGVPPGTESETVVSEHRCSGAEHFEQDYTSRCVFSIYI